MGFRYRDFAIERVSPRSVTLKHFGPMDKVSTLGKYPGYASALCELLSRLAEEGRDFQEVEAHWETFSRHLQSLYAKATDLEAIGLR